MFGKKSDKPSFKPGGASKSGAPKFLKKSAPAAPAENKYAMGGTVAAPKSGGGTVRGAGCAVKGKSFKGCC